MPAADRHRAFDRFVRLGSARTRHSGETTGTGLGLSIARDIVTAHGGTVAVTATVPDGNAAGHGATFTVCLPVTGPASDTP
ncbi:ATP-binding protein [Streptomyces sp. NPDC058246]|uniref:ATP-binding protein n=1 Tax=Streptomyces sp. NPDC058246 TaxID=3346400 RepID=UPI0036E062B8